jgi:nicotinamidase-related amidase
LSADLLERRPPIKPALLVLDPQNDFFAAGNPNLEVFQRTVPIINAAAALFRERGWPVIFIQHTSAAKPEGSYDWSIYPAFDLQPGDLRLPKSYSNAYWKSGLAGCLESLGIDFVLVAGYLSEFCVLSTYRGALERGYGAALLNDALASLEDRRTGFVLELCKTLTLEEFSLLASPD